MIDINEVYSDIKPFGFVLKNASMKDFTTFKTGGTADLMIYPSDCQNAAEVVKYANQKKIPLTVIGGGSNLLIGDKGIRGIVVRMAEDDRMKGSIKELEPGRMYADAIVKKRDFIEYAANRGYSDVEFMVGIPGCIGGGVIMNAGTFMGNFIGILDKISYISNDGNVNEMNAHAGMDNYRGLRLSDAGIIWGAEFTFSKMKKPEEIFGMINEIKADRLKKHPQEPSAGSVFKNPEGFASWKLVNDSGLRGKSVGGAMVSDLHTNFIINTGNATSKDVRSLIELVQEKVLSAFGVTLSTEVRMIGEF
jgi:UDP-N-acetylmuramate dehydrogenase